MYIVSKIQIGATLTYHETDGYLITCTTDTDNVPDRRIVEIVLVCSGAADNPEVVLVDAAREQAKSFKTNTEQPTPCKWNG